MLNVKSIKIVFLIKDGINKLVGYIRIISVLVSCYVDNTF